MDGLLTFLDALGALDALLFIFVVIAIAAWVLWGYSCMKVLKALGYPNPWMAWIPNLNTFALAHCTADKEGNTKVISWKLPTIVFSFWFVAGWILAEIPNVGSLLNLVLQVVCMGTCYIFIYSMCENKKEEDVRVIAYVSGLIPLVALCKFLSYTPDEIAKNIANKNMGNEPDQWDEGFDDDRDLLE